MNEQCEPMSDDCCFEDVAAYVDGELSADEQLRFEVHMRSCSVCGLELNKQKRLLAALEVVLRAGPGIDLPRGFAHKVAVRADSDVRGLRDAVERATALKLSLLLAGAGVVLTGFEFGLRVLKLAQSAATIGSALALTIMRPVYDGAEGLLVLLRVLTRQAWFGGGGLSVAIVLIALTLAGWFMLRSGIGRYQRS